MSQQGSNNNLYLPNRVEGYRDATTYGQLNEAARDALLRDNGYLFGVKIDDNDGPRRGVHQVARYTSTLPPDIQETNNIDSEVIVTENNRDTNYVHKGWSLSASLARSPWIFSRISRNDQANINSRSITKHIVIRKLRVELSLEDLSPVPELERHFRQASERSTRFEKSNAVYRVFQRWGDVIPLAFDVGASLAVTDSEPVARDYLANRSYLGLQRLLMSETARISTQGGDPATLYSEDNIRAWLGRSVPPSQWEQVKIIRVAPLTAILNNELQDQLARLHQSLTTYCPTNTDAVASNGTSFEGAAHAFNTVSQVAVCSGTNYITSISITYTANPSPVTYGAGQANHEFTLLCGEHITDVMLWKNGTGICAIQFSTNQGRTSKHFGSEHGYPEILRSPGCYLSAFSGIFKDKTIKDLQTIWRHDVQASGLSGDREFPQYLGGTQGSPFNDWPFVQHSDSTHIASIRFKCDYNYIRGIQITYRQCDPGRNTAISQQGNYHGGSDGNEYFFHLSHNEHIVTITGHHDSYRMHQLSFVTNTGRTSPVFGGNAKKNFTYEAPKTRDGRDTRLHYVCGKSSNLLDGLLFVWAPL